MEEVNDEGFTEEVMAKLEEVVVKQCLQLALVSKMMGTDERGKKVAAFMKHMMGEFCLFNLVERTLVVRFLTQAHTAIEKAMVEGGQYDLKNRPKIMEELENLIIKTRDLADLAFIDYKKDQEEKKHGKSRIP